MTKEKIINYVMNTPYNTNPAILSQMLDEVAGESGGGSSDFSMATLTIIKNTDFNVNAPIITTATTFMGSEYASICDFEFISTDDLNNGDTDIVLYRGSALAMVTYHPSINIEITAIGAIEKIVEDAGLIIYKITGDCTITGSSDSSGGSDDSNIIY